MRTLVQFLAISYLVGVSTITLLLWGLGDVWWPASFLLFGPRWVAVSPLLLLGPLAIVFGRRAIPWLLAGLLLTTGPFMGGRIGWQRLGALFAKESPQLLRVISYNCGDASPRHIVRFVTNAEADLVVLNEWPTARPLPLEMTTGWYYAKLGGNVLLSRSPIDHEERIESDRLRSWQRRAFRCQVDSGGGPIQVVVLHLATPRDGLAQVRESGLDGLAAMHANTEKRRVQAELFSQFAGDVSGPLIIAGDFNTPVEGRIYRQFWSGWKNAFSHAGFGFGHTKFDHFLTDFGVRIDHILVSSHWRVHSAWVGPDLGGDHRPLIAEISLRPQKS